MIYSLHQTDCGNGLDCCIQPLCVAGRLKLVE